jgi:hypothetical protein
MDTNKLLDEIQDLADVEAKDLPQTTNFGWFPRRTPFEVAMRLNTIQVPEGATPQQQQAAAFEQQAMMDSMKITIFQVGKPCPFNTSMDVLMIFEDDGEARIYAVQTRPEPFATPLPGTLYRISKVSPVYSATAMPPDVFKQEIAKELQVLYDDTEFVAPDDNEKPETEGEDASDEEVDRVVEAAVGAGAAPLQPETPTPPAS